MDDRFARVRALIANGEKVYRACDQVGLPLQSWYRHRSGVEAYDLRRRLNRLKKQRDGLAAQVGALDKRISATTKRLSVALEGIQP